MTDVIYAHSFADRPRTEWETLRDHSAAVAALAEQYAIEFGFGKAARALGLLHDIGKTAAATQAYLSHPPESGAKGPDHSTAGAREAEKLYGKGFGRVLAFAIAGHHSGLADHSSLHRRLYSKSIEPYDGWSDHIDQLPFAVDLRPTKNIKPSKCKGFSQSFLVRMLFSCLADADFLETERFYTGVKREHFADLAVLRERLRVFLESKRSRKTPLNILRSDILDQVVRKASLKPGIFTLTVPTGGGKTLTSLAFALDHAIKHGLKRIIYVIPYTSIIEQTASEFRKALATTTDVLEHHSSFDWDSKDADKSERESLDGLSKLRKASENWDVPIVVTTAVQFFESLFSNRPSRCRKLHNIAQSVVILDEAQTLPLKLLRPCMAAINELAHNYGTTIVLCTATQPALRECDGFRDQDGTPSSNPKKIGFKVDGSRELADDPKLLAKTLERVSVEWIAEPIEDEVIVNRFAQQQQMLCIVNNRRHARQLFDLLSRSEETCDGAFHLTTLMCAKHRRSILAEVRRRLQDGLPVRLVSTSLMEAGVDVDFPEVWRSISGIDSIAQAAGRCNREGRLKVGRVTVFEPIGHKSPPDLVPSVEAARSVLRTVENPLSLEGIHKYFGELYWLRGAEAMDAATLEGERWPILDSIAERCDTNTGTLDFDFESIARAFRFIDDHQATVVVPYDSEAVQILRRLAVVDLPHFSELRKPQQYSVSIPLHFRDSWLASGVLRPVIPALPDGLLCFDDLAHYRADTGVDLLSPERRESSLNIL